ncbi:hypothetical protein C8Z91_00800 [Paenibacillus elgii]|uniref:Uncharacterized protein n=1 Tax=Paenibacillus elgii TaxID=189691 RepID=A0A2T6GAG8_9BACL|nr:hypothetical protein [Paenibacillus elgii]PUA41143.1 hypothetical protein C8Z91_00800 [Paenibacillus elgii]
MSSAYKVCASCSASSCNYAPQQDAFRTASYESSFSLALFVNGLNELDMKIKCPQCGHRMFYYPVTWMAEPVHHD